eukprot:6183862-Pleurochrysis_carterae.AAC.1
MGSAKPVQAGHWRRGFHRGGRRRARHDRGRSGGHNNSHLEGGGGEPEAVPAAQLLALSDGVLPGVLTTGTPRAGDPPPGLR